MSNACFVFVTQGITNCFRRYGEFVGRYPLPFIILPIVIFGGMGAGLIALENESDLEKVYFPRNSRAQKDRDKVRDLFPSQDEHPYSAFSQSDKDNAANIIFKTKKGESIFDPIIATEINGILAKVRDITASGKKLSDICSKTKKQECVVDGEYVLQENFRNEVAGKVVTYPVWNNLFLFSSVGERKVERGKLVSAAVVRVSFKLIKKAKDWKEKFLEFCASLDPVRVEVAYETPDSLSVELDKGTKGDIIFFSLTITMCCIYASLVTSGGNPVSTRSMLSFGGILAAGLAIVGSMGLLSACGVKFVNIVGVVPFLIIGIGVDDMFLLMSSWSESLPSDPNEQNVDHVPIILGRTLAHAGVGITITSLTDFLAFGIGTVSVFLSVTNFSLYAGVAVIFCYLSNVTLFCASLAYHGRRVYSSRHSLTCRVTKPREQLKQEGRSAFYALICGGLPPHKEREDESPCEKFPSKILPLMFKSKNVSVIILIFFIGYLAVSVVGIVNLKQGLILQNLVQENSYYYKYLTFNDKYFPTQIPIGFIAEDVIDYLGNGGTEFANLLKEAHTDDGINSHVERCWWTIFTKMPLINSTTSANFDQKVQEFLSFQESFKVDVVFDSSKSKVVASRCFVLSEANSDQYTNADLMARMRKLADDSSLSVFAYHWSFVAYEQFVAVLPATLLLVGCAVAAITVVTFAFLPHFMMVLLVVVTIIMILTGIFGFLYFWNLTLSSITMIHLVMCVGFSVDFSAHVCTAYLLSHSPSRQERARDAIRHAAGPILNGATSTLLGVLFLLASKSYIFQSFFKVMFLVIIFGLMHAVFFLPAVLSLVGPEHHKGQADVELSSSVASVETTPAKEPPAAIESKPAASKPEAEESLNESGGESSTSVKVVNEKKQSAV
ncbi:hypothetical protein ACOMHN_031581 [Nucella lapillus]